MKRLKRKMKPKKAFAKKKSKKRTAQSSYLHYVWQPFAFMDFRLFVFENQKVEDWKVWKYAFEQNDHPKDANHQYPGMTCYDVEFQTYTCAVALMKSEDGCIDLSTIVHECTHVTQHYVNLLVMNSKDDDPKNEEFGPELCSSLVLKILEILNKEKVKVVNRYDTLGTANVVKCRR